MGHGAAAAAAKSLQLCPTLCNPRDGSPPGSPVPGILQARTLEWVAISFSNACWVRGKPLPFFHIHDIETYSCFLVAHKKTVQFYFLEKLQRETKKPDVLKVIEMQPLWLSLLPFVVLTSSWIATTTGTMRQILPNKSVSSVQFSRLVVSDSLQPHELQHTRPPCPSPTHNCC